jgi:hypothetical protein
VTAATTAGGAPSNGFGFGAGETNEQWRAALLALAGAADGPSVVFDFYGTLCDPTTSWKIKLHPFTTTLAASSAIGATSVSFNAQPDQYMTPALNVGVSGAESQPNLVVMSVTGSGPYTAALTVTDPYTNSAPYGVPAKAHLSGAAVRGTWCHDGTHPGTEFYRVNAPALAAML